MDNCAELEIEWEWTPPAPLKLAGFRHALLNAWRKKHGDKCSECRAKMYFDFPKAAPRVLPRYATFDHIRPKAKGGSVYDLSNIRVICFRCNNRKADKWIP
ncbi:HNH endonuclease [Mesorhizobium mediterraneum]|uniref:HNH endonuclease n=1 Tax=Mesorhizobium mediterraneum TaxID=43617 RepID=UPI002557DF6A|nr:HNH endonuclease [Mesorhizobium mediterraneum]WIW52348.1 HNH endonuclease [Mesorhizobium mediterraneum]